MGMALLDSPSPSNGPPMRREMQLTISRLMFTLEEHLLYGPPKRAYQPSGSSFSSRGESAPTTTAIFSGLGRLCDSRGYMQSLMLPCTSGTTRSPAVSLVFVLQKASHSLEGSRRFDECHHNIRSIATDTPCNAMLVEHRFRRIRNGARPLMGDALRVR